MRSPREQGRDRGGGQQAGSQRRAISEDIATLQTLARRTDVGELTAGYGLVVADECHHVLISPGFSYSVYAVFFGMIFGFFLAHAYRRARTSRTR